MRPGGDVFSRSAGHPFVQMKESYHVDSRPFVFGRTFGRAAGCVPEVTCLVAQPDIPLVVACSPAVNLTIGLSRVLAASSFVKTDLRFRPVWCGPVCRSGALVLS
ncbi:hypothetical protein Bca101_059476 [Brassica carinata]